MRERQPNPEVHRDSVLSEELSDLTDPGAYLEVARRGMNALRELSGLVEK